jgi:hypothetical protein
MGDFKKIVMPALEALVELANLVREQTSGAEAFDPVKGFPALAHGIFHLQRLLDPDEIPTVSPIITRASEGRMTLEDIDGFYSAALQMSDMLWAAARHGTEPKVLEHDFSPFLLALFGVMIQAGGEFRRIRLCTQCGRFFVAVPASKRFCSKPCVKQGGAERVHRLLARQPGYYARAKRKERAERRADKDDYMRGDPKQRGKLLADRSYDRRKKSERKS